MIMGFVKTKEYITIRKKELRKKSMLGIGKIICLKALVYIYIQVEKDSKDSWSQARSMGKEFIIMKMAISMMENGLMT